MYAELESLFIRNGWTFKVDGELKVPSDEDIETVLDELVSKIVDEPRGTQIEFSHFVVRKTTETHYDLFVHFGEL